MRRSSAVLGIVAVAILTSCGGDNSVGPLVTADLNALKIADGITVGSVRAYCITPTTCIAAAFRFDELPDDPTFGRQTLFSAYFQNLQGTYPNHGPRAELKLRFFRFQFFDVIESSDHVDAHPVETFSTFGNVQVGANHNWGNESPAAGRNSDTFVAEIGSGIVGCDIAPANPPLWFSFRTCPSGGMDGWVRVDFTLRRVGEEASNAPVRFNDFEFSFGDHNSGQFCTIGGDKPETCTVLPYSRVLRRP